MNKVPSLMSLPEFTASELEKFLSKRLIATLATKGRDGFPHVAPIWFLYENKVILLCTNGQTVKIKNIKADNSVAVLIDAAREGFKIRGLLIKGRAEVLEGSEARNMNRRIHLKYMGAKALKHPRVSAYLSGDDVTIRIRPENICSWDYMKLPISKIKGLNLSF